MEKQDQQPGSVKTHKTLGFLVEPIVRIFGLNFLTNDHAGRFASGWGWFCSFQPPLGVYTQQNYENTNINF
jgi:hypothetical protein